nr:putative late blight resistance protein homolog R1A-4 isoform X1 [Ipomoea batatas]
MVGLDDYFRLLRSALLDKYTVESTPIVFSLVGAPGIGKTTLCKKLYTDNKVVSHFDIQAWITIPPRYNGNVQQLLCHLLQSMRPTPLNQEIDILGSTVSQLKDQLHKHLKCKSSNILRSLFVFQEDFERYLSIPQWFESLDDVVSSNSNLQTLIVSGIDESTLGTRTLHLPSKIWETQHLRHLKLGNMYLIDPPNMVKEHLQTLVCAMPIHFKKKEVYYCRFPSIRKLKVVYKDILVPGCSGEQCCRNPAIIIVENFEDLLRLETLTVTVPVGSITLLERVGFPAKLKKLRLSETNFPVEVLRVIGQLPKLKVLKLENALYGRVWEVVEGGFPELTKLEVESTSLERWVANTIHPFPNLEYILLKRCYSLISLQNIPLVSAIMHRRLRSIKLEQCPLSVAISAKRYQEEMWPRNSVRALDVIVDGKAF